MNILWWIIMIGLHKLNSRLYLCDKSEACLFHTEHMIDGQSQRTIKQTIHILDEQSKFPNSTKLALILTEQKNPAEIMSLKPRSTLRGSLQKNPPPVPVRPWPVLDDAHVEGIQPRSKKSLVQILHVDFLELSGRIPTDWMGKNDDLR